MYSEKRRFDWPSLIVGILFVVAAIASFTSDPTTNVGIIVFLFTITVLLKGIYMIVLRGWVNSFFRLKLTPMLVIGVLDIILGLYFLFNMTQGIMLAPYVFAIWFLLDSIFGLFELSWISLVNRSLYWLTLITSVLGIVIGMMMLSNPIVSTFTLSFLVGLYLMMTGIMYVVRAFR